MAGERVLVIDDSPTITKVVQLVLTKAGYAVYTAPDGEAGLAALRATRPDVVLLDFVMPKMNGYQFCRELAADPKLRDIPVVLMSAKGDQVGERFVKVMGIVDYITKPFSPDAITAVVQHTVSKYGPTSASDDNPSLVTGEDLSATDEADRVQSRRTAVAQLRAAIVHLITPRLLSLLTAARRTESAPGPGDSTSTEELINARTGDTLGNARNARTGDTLVNAPTGDTLVNAPTGDSFGNARAATGDIDIGTNPGTGDIGTGATNPGTGDIGTGDIGTGAANPGTSDIGTGATNPGTSASTARSTNPGTGDIAGDIGTGATNPGTDDSGTGDISTGDIIDPGTGDIADPGTRDSINAESGDTINAGTGDLIRPGAGGTLNADSGDTINADSGDTINVGTRDTINVGARDLRRPGAGDIDAGTRDIDAGTGDLSNAGTGDLSNAGIGNLGDAGTGDLSNAGAADPSSGGPRSTDSRDAGSHSTDSRHAGSASAGSSSAGSGNGGARDAGDADAIRRAAEAALDDDALTRMLASLDLGLLGEASPGLRGDLRVVPLAEVLQLLDVQEQSGVLTVERTGARVEIYFRRGRVDQAIASGVPDEFLLGRFLLDAAVVPPAALETLLATRPDHRLIGRQLVALGHLAEPDLKSCLTRQSSELIYEILRWRHGRFRFAAGLELPPSVIDASLGLDVEAVLMEGYRRVDEWHLIERAIDNFDVVFLRNEDSVAQMGRGRLARDELAVLELVNGKNTVKEIVRKSRMGSFEVSKMLYRLLSIKLVRRRVLPVAV